MKLFLQKHKKRLIWISAILVVASSGYGYYTYAQPKAEAKYVLALPTRDLFIASLSGTGQVSGESQIDVKPKVSGETISVAVKEGQVVKKGDVLAQLDTHDAQKAVRDAAQSVRDAQISLDSARLSLSKLKTVDASTLLQNQNSVNQAQRALDKLNQGPDAYALQQAQSQVTTAEQNAKLAADGTPQVIRNAYDAAVGSLVSAMQTVSDSLEDADSVIGVDNTAGNLAVVNLLSALDQSQKNQAVADYHLAKPSVEEAKKSISVLRALNEDPQHIDAAAILLQDAIEKTTKLLSHTAGALNATLTSSSFSQGSLDQLKSMIQSDRSGVASKQTAMISLQQSITQAKTTYTNSSLSLEQAKLALDKLNEPADAGDIAAAEEKVKEVTLQLTKLKAGPDAVDIAMSENTVSQRQSALASAIDKLTDAKETLNDYTIRAPFDGVIAKVSLSAGDAASPSTAVVTLVTTQQIAEITLNEVDAVKVKVGQKVTLAFDAVDGLSLTGTVDEVGAIGAVTQGVVNYSVKIGFDAQDERIRPGMSVRASIIIQTDPDMLLVPNAAVKTSGAQHYVEIMDAASMTSSTNATNGAVTGIPRRQTVEVGSSNDTDTEITSGLNGDEQIVIQTIQPTTAKTTATAQTSALRSLTGGAGAGGGGATFRAAGGNFGR